MAGLTSLLILCHVTFLVSAFLKPPTNLKLVSKNFQHILTWDDPNNGTGIYYKVGVYRWGRDCKSVVGSKSCANITSRRCDLTKDFTDVLLDYNVIVCCFRDGEFSEEATTQTFSPISHTTLGPPLVEVRACDYCIEISIHPPISYLWSETKQRNISMEDDFVYPLLDYTITYGHSAESQHSISANDTSSVTVISKLLPNTNYCVSVDLNASTNLVPTIPSALTCVTTGPTEDSLGNVCSMDVIVPVVCGLLLFIGILLILFALDKAGYIGMRMKFFPKMLKSLPQSESRHSGFHDCISPAYIVPVEIISQKLEKEKCQENEEKIPEGGYSCRKKLVNSDTSAEDSSSPLFSNNSSSLESSGQMTGSSCGEQILIGHPIDSDVVTDSSGSFSPIPVGALELCSDIPFNDNGDFNVNLNAICIGTSTDTWKDLKDGGTLKEEPKRQPDVNPDRAGVSLNGDIISCTANVLVDLQPNSFELDSDDEELSDDGDHCDDHVVSGYMRR